MTYLYACKTSGECRKNLYLSYGWSWAHELKPQKGMRRYYPQTDDLAAYECCTGCHQPINGFIARAVNLKLGNAEPSIDDALSSVDNVLASLDELLGAL